MGLDRALAHRQAARDLRVRRAVGEEGQYLGLAGREAFDAGAGVWVVRVVV